jgi:hypothetical protein
VRAVLAGFVIFGLGAAIFLTTGRVLFGSGGIANRVWIAAALGVALVAVVDPDGRARGSPTGALERLGATQQCYKRDFSE